MGELREFKHVERQRRRKPLPSSSFAEEVSVTSQSTFVSKDVLVPVEAPSELRIAFASLAAASAVWEPLLTSLCRVVSKSELSPAFWKYLLSFDFQFRLPIATVHLLKHPSDSGAYDKDGQFVPERFDRLFDDFDKAGRGGINKCELDAFIESNNNPPNRAGNFGSKFEWGAAFDILHDSRGVVSREKLLKLYNGSVFEEVEREVAARKAGKRGGIRPVESTVLTKSA